MRELAISWIVQHGYIGVFSLLVFGIVGLPVPDEWLLTFSGYLVFKQKLHFLPALAACFFGSVCGISVSYTLGRTLGTYFLDKYGKLLHISGDHIGRVHNWFQRLGRWTLFVGYFIPGVRHLTGYLAGTYNLSVGSFALFAYTGALFWATVFVSSGYFLGEGWSRFSDSVQRNLLIATGIVGASGLTYYLFRARRVTRR